MAKKIADQFEKNVMRLEREIDAKREVQRKLLLSRVREIQKSFDAGKGTVSVQMVHDPVDGYRAAVTGVTYDGVKLPRNAAAAEKKIEDLMTDYSFVFAGTYGEATISPESEDILFET